MNYFFAQHLIFIPLFAYIVATLFKGFILWKNNVFNLQVMLSTGGMPSGHSALVSSLATAIGIKYGPQSDLFVLALVFAAIVIYDAMNIRYQSGLHAHALNTLKGEKKLNESLGHLPSETLIGSMIGVFVAAFFMQI
jgi:uncharacterized protein